MSIDQEVQEVVSQRLQGVLDAVAQLQRDMEALRLSMPSQKAETEQMNLSFPEEKTIKVPRKSPCKRTQEGKKVIEDLLMIAITLKKPYANKTIQAEEIRKQIAEIFPYSTTSVLATAEEGYEFDKMAKRFLPKPVASQQAASAT